MGHLNVSMVIHVYEKKKILCTANLITTIYFEESEVTERSGRVVRALDAQAEGHGFNPALGHFVYAWETYLSPNFLNPPRCIYNGYLAIDSDGYC